MLWPLTLTRMQGVTTKGLSGNALKVIAIIAMTIDHLAWVGIETYEQAETPLQISLHCVGRLTAPIMIFFVAEGYHHTHDFRRYLRRLLMLAVASHFAFCYFNMSSFNPFSNLLFNATSIAWPLLWGLILLKVWDMERLWFPAVSGDQGRACSAAADKRWTVCMKVIVTLVACLLTFTSDWSCAAPLAILAIGRNRDNFCKQMLWLMLIISLYAVAFFVFHSPTYGMVHLACWLAVPLLALYNGQRGRCRWLGKFFYYYYPAHMALIGLLARMM